MILQALKEYYDRKAADPESDIAPEGWERKEIPFIVVIQPNGQFVSLEDTREQVGKRLIGKILLVPRSRTRTGGRSYETTFLLWDHAGYLFQLAKSADSKELEKAANQHRTWLKSLEELPDSLKRDEGVAAVCKFYQSGGVAKVKAAPQWPECEKLPSCNVTFRLVGDVLPVPCRPAVKEHVSALIGREARCDDDGAEDEIVSRCLITGVVGPIARTHGRTPINKDTKSLVAFQKNAGYDSYGKEQCYNAPVGKSAEFAYTTALNTLLKSENTRMRVGDATAVFWADRRTKSGFDEFFGDLWQEDPDRNIKAVRSLFDSPKSGTYATDCDVARFYVLGLAPNAARISVRFWLHDTVAGMAEKIRQHFDDILIVHGSNERHALSLKRLLRSMAVQEDEENISPNMAGETMRAILAGVPYPQTLLQAAIRRTRAEQAKKNKQTGKSLPNVPYERAALIKACINRATRYKDSKHKEELKVSLDESNANIGYRLGRLFATLEKIQQDANPGINATIRDKFYGSASSTPVTVFGILMRLKNHHLAKLPDGFRIVRERLLCEIMAGIGDFPANLKLEEQGRFAIGYYHQMQEFYTKKEKQD